MSKKFDLFEKPNLKKEEFKKEFVKMAMSCVGMTEVRAKNKAQTLWRKYQSLISYSTNLIEEERSGRERTWKKYMTLRDGRIDYYRDSDFARGFILIKDIEQIERHQQERHTMVVVTMKTGRKIKLSKDYEYLLDIF